MNNTLKRRSFLKGMAGSLAAGAFAGTSCISAREKISRIDKTGEKPNIVLIMADDLGYEGLSSYGSADYKTPQLDKLAKEGMKFNHCHAQPLCTPSRVKIMTGRYNLRNYYNFGYLDTAETTFGNIMKQNGYATAIVGKWQLGGDGGTVKNFGFDEHCLWHIKGRDSRFWRPRIYENGKVRDDLCNKDTYGPDVFSDYAMKFMERKKDQPFFIYFPMALTHWPFDPTPDTEDGEGSKIKGKAYDGGKGGHEYFDDMIAYMDKITGCLVNKLEELGLRKNTLFMFTGDNGTYVEIKSRMTDGRIIQGGKGSMKDSGTRVPFIASWPDRIPAGRETDTLVDFTDFLPTIAEAGGITLPENLQVDGQSFLRQLSGEKRDRRQWIICDYNPRPRVKPTNPEQMKKALKKIKNQVDNHTLGRWIRNQRYKLYANGDFYDVKKDVLEKRNIAPGTGSPEVEHLRKLFQKQLDKLPPWKPFRRKK